MAKYTVEIRGNLEHFMDYLEGEILSSSHSASLEDTQTMQLGEVKCIVQVYERYSYFGGNRVSLNVTAFGVSTVTALPLPQSQPAAARRCFSRSTPSAKKISSTNLSMP